MQCAKERHLTLIMEDQRARSLTVAQSIADVTIQVLPLQGFIQQLLSFAECTDWLTRIGQARRTDSAVLSVLHAAAGEIHRLRTT